MKNTIEKEYNDQISQEEEAVQTADEYVELTQLFGAAECYYSVMEALLR